MTGAASMVDRPFGVPSGKSASRRPSKQKATDEQILHAYAQSKSVWKVAEVFGMCGQSVHERLVKLGASTPIRIFTAAEDEVIRLRYESHANHGTLAALAASMGRTKHLLARRARELGLTDRNRKRPYIADGVSVRVSAWLKKNPHPRGMAGKRHAEETKDTMSQHSFNRWHSMSKAAQIAFTDKAKVSWKQGWREVGGQRIYFRSSWEANYARYLEWLRIRGEIIEWKHEPETFWFEKIRRGTRSYLPDFRVVERGGAVHYHEVKGWMDAGSKTKLKRMAIYHPHISMILIDRGAYKAIAKVMKPILDGWEGA
jgi:hypothetical protein